VSGGLVTGINCGEVVIKATSKVNDEIYAEYKVTVKENTNDILPTNINIIGPSMDVYAGDIITLVAVVDPLEANKKAVFWTLDNESIARIEYLNEEENNSKINLVTLNSGEVTVKVTSQADASIYSEFVVIINEVLPISIRIDGKTSTSKGLSTTLAALVEPSNTTNKEVIWYSSDETVATISDGVVTGVNPGVVTIKAVSKVTTEVYYEVEFTVTQEFVAPTEIELDGENTMYIGYKSKLKVNVKPENASNEVSWEIHDSSKDLATVDENGIINILASGKLRIRAISKLNPNIKSSFFIIDIPLFVPPQPSPDLNGYEIVIMDYEGDLSTIDPFSEGYNNPDKIYKQKAWAEIEINYNCKIRVKTYPEEAPYGHQRIKWIIDNANNGTSKCDIAAINPVYLKDLVKSDAAIDVTDLYGKYGLNQMEPHLKTAGTYNGKLYALSTYMPRHKTYVDLGLFYNYGWIKELNVESPSKLFNDGKWTYSGFEKWVLDVQSKLEKNEYVLGGAPFYYWSGMSNAAGVILTDQDCQILNVYNSKSKNASDLIYSLVEKGAVNPNVTWSERDDIPSSFWRTDGGTIMTTGYLSNIKNNIWSGDMWGEGTTEFGYVPFPYPDDLAKEDTKINYEYDKLYIYVSGKPYPEALGTYGYNKVWIVINEMFQNADRYLKNDPLYDPEEIIEVALGKYIDDKESIEAVKFYNAKRVIFDPVKITLYNYNLDPYKTASNNTFFKGKDYMTEFENAYKLYTKINNNYLI